MAKQFGKFAKVYINTADYAEPTWVEWSCVEEVTIGITKDEITRTCRGEATNGGFNRTGVGNGNMDVSLTILKDPADATFVLAEAAMVADTVLDVLVYDGDKSSADSSGWRLPGVFTAWSEGQPINDYMAIDATIKPAGGSQAVEFESGVQ